ncbi:MAG: hypothetical protein IPN18_21590 [Ignavibacteriales bacterium]|nr:hypothetical protein [Ignavibacteriales bacterium]
MFPGSPHTIISPVFKQNLDNNQLTVTFSHIDVSPYSKISYKKYAYHPGSSNGGDITLTTKYGPKKNDTILNKVLPKLISFGKKIQSPETELFVLIKKCWEENQLEIDQKILDAHASLPEDGKTKCGLSIIVLKDQTTSAENLYLGARLIEEELRFRFCGRSYMAVPRLLIEDVENYQIVYEAFSEFKAIDKNKQSTYEDEFMTYMAEQKNHFTLDMIFFEEDAKSKAIQLKSHIEEIFPSRFKKIFVEAREAVDNHPTFAKHLIFEETIFEKETGKKIEKKEIFSQKFRFGKLLQFFDKGNYSIIQVVFDGSPIDKTLLYSKFMEFYRNNYQKSTKLNKISTLRKPIIDAISVINYLAYLKLISIEPLNYEVIMDSDNESVKKEGKFDLENFKPLSKIIPSF